MNHSKLCFLPRVLTFPLSRYPGHPQLKPSTLGMCWKLKDFGLTGRFLGESEEAYIGMNEAFAKGDRKYLEEICTPSMYAKLKGQLKDRVGRYEWRYHGLLEKPQIVSIRQGQIGGHVLIQMIVRLKSNQVRAHNGFKFERGVHYLLERD